MAASDKYHYLPKSSDINKVFDSELARIKAYKSHLAKGLEALIIEFKRNISISQLLKARSALVDVILTTSWQQFEVDPDCSLIAVGGYGRSELQPYSDIDLLILLPDSQLNTKALEQWLAFLWDIGLEIGHSVRTIEECEELAKSDISIATSLMESRILYGNKYLYRQLKDFITKDEFWPITDFYEAKFNEQKNRHGNFKDTSFNLEPNIKSNPGGLRDIQTMQWIALKFFKTNSLQKLIELGILTRREYKAILSHRQLLNKIRFALHAVAGKREERLLFEHQKIIAQWLGFEDSPEKLAVEQLMQPYYQAVMAIRNLNGLFLQIFEQEYLESNKNESIVELDELFILKQQRIALREEYHFEQVPWALIKIFHHISLDQNIKQIDAFTLRKIRSSQHLINKKFRKDPKVLTAVQDFLSAKQMTSRGFALMKRTNVLGSFLPLFAKIEGQMQFDLFHAYTVDEHTLFLLRYLVRYNRPECQHEFPICSEIMSKQKDHSCIHLAAIFHDIAKGRGGDHSELGSEDALHYCLSIGLSKQKAEMVAWLVKSHLLMSMVAQRKDIHDVQVIEEFCLRIPSQEHLDLLYVLTVSDIRATNPSLWNSWKESLLKELYLSSQYHLSQAAPIQDITEQIKDQRQQILTSLSSDLKTGAKTWLNDLGDDYLLRYHPEQILWQLPLLINQNNYPQVSIKNHRNQAGTEIFIAIPDQVNLFAAITSSLSQLNLSIQNAILFTAESGLCLDTFVVLDQDHKPLTAKSRIKEVRQQLLINLQQLDTLSLEVTRLQKSRYKSFDVRTDIQFSHDPQTQLSRLEITALDRPALLAKIAIAFRDTKIKVHAAKVVTLGERVEDTFIISAQNNQALNPEQQLQLKDKLLDIIKE